MVVLYGILPGAMIANGFIGYFLKKWAKAGKKFDILVILYPILLVFFGEIIFLLYTRDYSDGSLRFTFGMDSAGHYSLNEAIISGLPFFAITTSALTVPLWIGHIVSSVILKKKSIREEVQAQVAPSGVYGAVETQVQTENSEMLIDRENETKNNP